MWGCLMEVCSTHSRRVSGKRMAQGMTLGFGKCPSKACRAQKGIMLDASIARGTARQELGSAPRYLGLANKTGHKPADGWIAITVTFQIFAD
jgi:hypothetical protein